MRFFRDVKKHFPFIINSAKAQLKSEVAGSYLNWIWWILNPLFTMLIYVFIFGVVFNGREANFPVYIFIGLTVWNFFNATVMESIKAVKTHKPIISRIYLPKYILILTDMAVNGFKMLISMAVVVVMMLFMKISVNLSVFYILPVMLVLIIVTFGFSCLCMHLGVFIQDLSNVMKVIMRLLYFMTGIFFDIMKRIPAPHNARIMKANPMAMILKAFRGALLNKSVLTPGLLAIWGGIGVIISVIGVTLIYKNENSYVKVL